MRIKRWIYTRFIEPFIKPTPIGFTKEVFDTLQSYAESIHPNEFICFLEYDMVSGSEIVKVSDPQRTIDPNQEYSVIVDMYMTATKSTPTSATADTSHLPTGSIIGTLHTHPSGNTRPSETDESMFAAYPLNIILGYPYTKNSMKLYTSDSTERNNNLSIVTLKTAQSIES